MNDYGMGYCTCVDCEREREMVEKWESELNVPEPPRLLCVKHFEPECYICGPDDYREYTADDYDC